MKFIDKSCTEFIDALASKSAVPGGGGASALVGAIGMALGSMVGNLTAGKKKYADVEADILALMEKADALQKEFLRLVDEDAAAFEPLSKAYSIPKDDPSREQVMEEALKLACTAPLEIMRASAKAIDLHTEFAAKGSALAISDVGAGITFCASALMGASLNIYINTKSMKDRAFASEIESEADALLQKYCTKAGEVYGSVVARLE